MRTGSILQHRLGFVVSDQHRLTSGISTAFTTHQSCHRRVFDRGNTCSNSGFKEKLEVAQSCLTLRLYRLEPTKLLSSWDSPDKNTGVGCHSLLQGICQFQEQNPGVLHCRQILYPLTHQGSQIFKRFTQALVLRTNWRDIGKTLFSSHFVS